MTFGVFLAVMAAAFLHALWNALIKLGTSKIGAMVVLSVMEVPIGLGVAFFMGPINPAAIPWVIAAGITHFAYKYFLSYAYERGDLSRVYPIARGAAPMLVTVAGVFLLTDVMSSRQYLAIAVLAAGILMMARGVFASDENRKLVPFALGSALATACYTLIDGQGARISGNAVSYIAWVFVADGLIFSLGMLAMRGRKVVPLGFQAWKMGTIGAAASFGAYAIAVWAMTIAPIALVAALRETSILFAVLIGWLVFGERMSREKAAAALVIVAGVILTRV
ncbi:DMT family transporter [Pseudomonas sp. GX19020]|uniref:DMT family transporter n=1 Tax=Pseudomonadota TaxID=1224 RepID=UPI00089C9B92|nr:DMT family transporter [Rhodobacter sp. 24-YEA-8]MCL4068246.1 DMT family transporter [Pseudomonas sp. GX19020]SEC30103.1 EamA-like transporter family protein [Rhodobacter sp. 24-YEA-8]